MTPPSSASEDKPDRKLDEIGRRFQKALQDGETPKIEDFLAGFGATSRVRLIAMLLPLELKQRRAMGECPDATEYLGRFPEAVAAIRAWFPDDEGDDRPAAGAEVTEDWQPPSSRGEVILSIVTGPHRGQRFVFKEHDTLVVGRAPDARWRLDKDPYFSRYHFRIEANPPNCRLIDLESRNGTVVNDRRVTDVSLQDGDNIQCGATRITVAIHSPQAQDLARIIYGGATATDRDTGLTRIGEFEIKRLLGRGSMGAVYEAVERPSGRTVAVKVIRPGAAIGSQEVQLFLREVSILGRLKHPRIVEFISMGLHDGRVYLAMEHIAQFDLRSFLADLSLTHRIKAACGIIAQVLEGLSYAHELGIVHRDVKPGNILVHRTGHKILAKLADFGLAKSFLTAGFSSISADNETRGTLAYMPPEQIINCRFAQPQCDIYAAGVCLYVFLTQRLPFEMQDGPGAVAHVLNSRPIAIDSRDPDMPTPLCQIIHRALERQPEDRFPSASAMRQTILEFLAT